MVPSTFSTSSVVLGLYRALASRIDSQVWPHGQAQQQGMSDSVVSELLEPSLRSGKHLPFATAPSVVLAGRNAGVTAAREQSPWTKRCPRAWKLAMNHKKEEASGGSSLRQKEGKT